jgi:hypothetical protein
VNFLFVLRSWKRKIRPRKKRKSEGSIYKKTTCSGKELINFYLPKRTIGKKMVEIERRKDQIKRECERDRERIREEKEEINLP